jgi:hypothetical protein
MYFSFGQDRYPGRLLLLVPAKGITFYKPKSIHDSAIPKELVSVVARAEYLRFRQRPSPLS